MAGAADHRRPGGESRGAGSPLHTLFPSPSAARSSCEFVPNRYPYSSQLRLPSGYHLASIISVMSTLITKESVPKFDGSESTPVIGILIGRPTELHQIAPPRVQGRHAGAVKAQAVRDLPLPHLQKDFPSAKSDTSGDSQLIA